MALRDLSCMHKSDPELKPNQIRKLFLFSQVLAEGEKCPIQVMTNKKPSLDCSISGREMVLHQATNAI